MTLSLRAGPASSKKPRTANPYSFEYGEAATRPCGLSSDGRVEGVGLADSGQPLIRGLRPGPLMLLSLIEN